MPWWDPWSWAPQSLDDDVSGPIQGSTSAHAQMRTSSNRDESQRQHQQLAPQRFHHDRAQPSAAPAETPGNRPLHYPELYDHRPSYPSQGLIPTAFILSLSPTISLTSLAVGFFSGLYTGSHKAGLVFMAENAHRRPDTVQGWYFYNKTKNYKVLLAGLGRGVSTGLRLAAWTSVFVVLDAACLQARTRFLLPLNTSADSDSPANRHKAIIPLQLLGHWSDGLIAGQGAALLASTAYRMAPNRFLLLGTVAGATTGALQDLRDDVRARSDPIVK